MLIITFLTGCGLSLSSDSIPSTREAEGDRMPRIWSLSGLHSEFQPAWASYQVRLSQNQVGLVSRLSVLLLLQRTRISSQHLHQDLTNTCNSSSKDLTLLSSMDTCTHVNYRVKNLAPKSYNLPTTYPASLCYWGWRAEMQTQLQLQNPLNPYSEENG